MKWLAIILVLSVGFSACKKKNKDQKMTITGQVTDNSDNSGVAGAIVKIYYKPYQNGVFMTTYSLLTSTTADGSGVYNFDIEKPSTSDFKFVVESSNYFSTEKVVNPDNLSLDNTNTIDFSTDPSGTLSIHLKNNIPFDSTDYFQFQTLGLNYSCSTCCSSTPVIRTGDVFDTTFSCSRYAKRYIKFTWFKTKNGVTTLKNDSVYCAQGTTTLLEVLY